jgi:hypothetical protein
METNLNLKILEIKQNCVPKHMFLSHIEINLLKPSGNFTYYQV